MCESGFNTAGERRGMCESGFNTAGERHGMCESALKQSRATSIRTVKNSVTPRKTRVLSDPCLLTGYFKNLRNSAPLYNCELLRFKLISNDICLVGPIDCWCPANGASVFTDCGPHYGLVMF
jgi:hypothetical protein